MRKVVDQYKKYIKSKNKNKVKKRKLNVFFMLSIIILSMILTFQKFLGPFIYFPTQFCRQGKSNVAAKLVCQKWDSFSLNKYKIYNHEFSKHLVNKHSYLTKLLSMIRKKIYI